VSAPRRWLAAALAVALLPAAACDRDAASDSAASAAAPAVEPAPPASETGGFDGARAFAHVERMVAIGPRWVGSEGHRQTQAYIREQLKSFGCDVEEEVFKAETPLGPFEMRNLVAKIPGRRDDVLLLLTHYDTLRKEGFVGANDGGSSTGLMLEMARLLCAAPREMTVWIAFLDGEEAFVEWSDTDGTYGSRQMAARLALSGELKKVRAVILADMVGAKDARFYRETNSTRWLVELVWETAARLGYQDYFLPRFHAVEDDHIPFVRRGVPAVDIIELETYPYWHTLADTLDKLSPRTLAVVGHVILESLSALEAR
jgi:glutaminyl-peptide cyclotransferase